VGGGSGRRSGGAGAGRPVAVAITGGIGAGKTEALHAFARHGAATISSDDIVHTLLRENRDVQAALVERFGEGILDDVGNVDRPAIGDRVFGDSEALAWLENLLHPLVVAEYMAWRDRLAERPDPPAVSVTEVPLLYEVGGESRFDKVVVITASPELRRARARVTSAEQREQHLIPDEQKVERADYVYINDGTREDLDRFVAAVVAELSAA
jgi:dephospho-CoA kinase